MPWATNSALPPAFKSLPDGAKTLARRAGNAAIERGASDEDAIAAMWSAVRNAYVKQGDGWRRKAADEVVVEFGILAVDLADNVTAGAEPGEDGLVEGARVQLVPMGTFHHPKYGRFTVTANHLARMIRNAFREGRDLLLDWEHKSGDPEAPVSERRASGWIDPKTLSVVNGWLTGVPRWTTEAAKAIVSKSFRWISPEFVFDRLAKVGGGRQGATLLAAALTNRPFMPGQAGVSLSEGWDYSPEEGDQQVEFWKKLAAKLKIKLADDASEEDAAEAVATKLADDGGGGDDQTPDDPFPEEVRKALTDRGWDGESDLAEFVKKLGDLPDGVVTITASDLAELKASAKDTQALKLKLAERDAEKVVKLGMAEGKIPPAQEEFWMKFVLDNGEEKFEEYLKTAPVICELGERGSGAGGGEPSMTMSEVEKEIDTKALAYMETQKKLGVEITLADATEHVLNSDEGLQARYNAAMERDAGATPQHSRDQ